MLILNGFLVTEYNLIMLHVYLVIMHKTIMYIASDPVKETLMYAANEFVHVSIICIVKETSMCAIYCRLLHQES